MSAVAIGRPYGLRFETAPGDEYLTVDLVLPDVMASKSIYGHHAHGFAELVIFFEELAGRWRGWDGVRSYESLEGDLRLDATHNGHVVIRVRLRNYIDASDWVVEGEIMVDPGEELSSAAADLQAAFS